MHQTRHPFLFLALLSFLCGCQLEPQTANSGAPAGMVGSISMPALFSDNMVLQQHSAAPIWGWGAENATVTVRFRDKVLITQVKDGVWNINLGHLDPGGPDTLIVSSGNMIQFHNVLVGEVWVASGQSNMEFPLHEALDGDAAISSSANPMIHLLKVPRLRMNAPTNDITASWTECNPTTTSNFSAVEYYFARDLQKTLGVPVGVIESCWGGTPAECWMQESFLRLNPRYRLEVMSEWSVYEDRYEHAMRIYQERKAAAASNGTPFTATAPHRPWKPGELYNGMIAPLAGYGMKGVIWYQGESNAGNAEEAWQYHRLFPDLIRDWRMAWNEGAFPFLFVQLAPHHAIDLQPTNSSWASVREAQTKTLSLLPNVGMAVITDLGNQRNIHPIQKQQVGDRLALAALGVAYHKHVEYDGPILARKKIEENQLLLTFNHADGGLVSHNGALEGFAICGDDGHYVWANAEIKGRDQVLVHSTAVQHPINVRFGWADFPVVNLWNKAGLPASPFRTDNFDLQPLPKDEQKKSGKGKNLHPTNLPMGTNVSTSSNASLP